MTELDKILKDNGIKSTKTESPKDVFNNMFDNPIDMLDDLFNNILPSIYEIQNKKGTSNRS